MNASGYKPGRYDVLVYLPSVASMLGAEPGTPAGGAEVQMPLLAKGLARVGSRVCMVAFDESGSVPDSVAGVDIVRRPPYQARRGPWGKLAEAWAIRASVAAADADTVLTRSAVPTTGLLALAAKLQRRRFVYSSASDADFEMERVEHKRRNIALFHLGIRLADIVVVQNERQRGLCENRFRRTPVVIKSIAEPAEMRASEPEAFLWAGRIVSYKQPLAFLELARHVPEAKFWMVGIPEPGADRQQLLAEVRRLSAELPNLELLDPLPRGELMSLVERSVAIVNTSEYEGLSNTFLEAWARGVPALSLAHDPDGLLERLELGAFAGGSAGRLATLARSLWEGRHRQQELAERCRRYVRHEHAPESIYRQWRAALGLGVQESVSEPLLAGAV